jgi:hypothetical protein
MYAKLGNHHIPMVAPYINLFLLHVQAMSSLLFLLHVQAMSSLVELHAQPKLPECMYGSTRQQHRAVTKSSRQRRYQHNSAALSLV